MPQALTTLARVKEWLGIPASNTSMDTVLSQMIPRASQAVFSHTSRSSFTPRVVNGESITGCYATRFMLREYPVIAIDSVTVNGVPIPAASTPQGNGFLIEPWDGYPPGNAQLVDLFGYDTGYGRQATLVTYAAGYQIPNESHTIPTTTVAMSTATVPMNAPFGLWLSDGGVVAANSGAAFDAVTGTPGPSEYALGSTAGDYIFDSSDDGGTEVLVTYGYVPADVEQAVLEFIGERNAYRSRIGVRSRALVAGSSETISYQPSGMTDIVRELLRAYKRTSPL